MQDLKELYQEVILDHNRNPRNFGCLEHPSCQARGHNPLCGDQLNLFIELAGDVIQNIQFQGRGCAISQASASLMTEAVKGLHVAEALALFELMHQFLTLDNFDVNQVPSMKLQVLAGVKAYPARVKCASLAWHTLQAALLQQNDIAKTE
jgi:nitrogen fixation NifU-like protein